METTSDNAFTLKIAKEKKWIPCECQKGWRMTLTLSCSSTLTVTGFRPIIGTRTYLSTLFLCDVRLGTVTALRPYSSPNPDNSPGGVDSTVLQVNLSAPEYASYTLYTSFCVSLQRTTLRRKALPWEFGSGAYQQDSVPFHLCRIRYHFQQEVQLESLM